MLSAQKIERMIATAILDESGQGDNARDMLRRYSAQNKINLSDISVSRTVCDRDPVKSFSRKYLDDELHDARRRIAKLSQDLRAVSDAKRSLERERDKLFSENQRLSEVSIEKNAEARDLRAKLDRFDQAKQGMAQALEMFGFNLGATESTSHDDPDNACDGTSDETLDERIARLVKEREGKRIGQEAADLIRLLNRNVSWTYQRLADAFETSHGTIANVLYFRCYA